MSTPHTRPSTSHRIPLKRSPSSSYQVGLPTPSIRPSASRPSLSPRKKHHYGDVSSSSSSEDEGPSSGRRSAPGTPMKVKAPLSPGVVLGRGHPKSRPTTSMGLRGKEGNGYQSSPLKSSKSMPRLRGLDGSEADKVIVCVRAKPTKGKECLHAYDLDAERSCLELSSTHPNVRKRGGKTGRESEYSYSFDALHLPPAPTQDLYDAKIAPLVEKTMQGFNSTIFAYGQTGSGKTHTMTGTEDEVGIIPLAIASVFEAIEKNPSRHYLLRVSYLEIYNESLRDLLSPLPPSRQPLPDSQKPTIHLENGIVTVRPLTEEIVKQPEQVLEVLRRGEKGRRVSGTDWNERSSRSHVVFTITVESNDKGDVRQSRLTLIDLAGSEKAASNLDRLSEGKYINKSLLALGTVIEQLSDKTRRPGAHIPYRNSKLTHLLENAIGGNANIAVICTLSLEEFHQSETLETLKFAARCGKVETMAKKGVVLTGEKGLLRAKEEEIVRLKVQLEELSKQRRNEVLSVGPGQREELEGELEEMEQRRSRLFVQLSSLNSEILSSRSIAGATPLQPGETPESRNRRRVSDFARSGFGLGYDLRGNMQAGRRAASNFMNSVVEEPRSHMSPLLDGDVARVATEKRAKEHEKVVALEHALDAAHEELAELKEVKQELGQLKRKFGDESAKRAELQRLLGQQREVTGEREKENAQARAEANRWKKELEMLKAERAVEIVSAPAMDEATRRRLGLPSPEDLQNPTPEALRHSGSLKDYRRLAEVPVVLPYTQSAKQISREREEIERLETVIRGLNGVNQALLGKVAEWRTRVTAQDELIKQFQASTASPSAPSTPKKQSVEKTYALSPSRTYNELASPSKLRHTPSKFSLHQRSDSATGWRDTPPPLPMTPAMEGSLSPRKPRRTLEHDMQRLETTHKVDKARAMFSSMEQEAMRVAGMESPLRRRA